MIRIKKKDIPAMRSRIAEEQGNCCALCGISLNGVVSCLDHNHKTGLIRSVLCLNCNGIEGKIFNLARRAKRQSDEPTFVNKVLKYWEYWNENPSSVLHPNHRTVEEKRIAKNKKAKKRRASKNKS